MKISVILPVYNVEKYIADCIKSLGFQSFKDFEVLLVDDGSPDRSCEIAEREAKKHSLNFRTIHQENKGVSAARNEGIRHAKGDYVLMVDSDDIIHPQFLEMSLQCMNNSSSNSVVFSNFKIVSENDNFSKIQEDRGIQSYSPIEAQDKFLYHELKFILPTLFIRKDFLLKHNIWFDENVRYSEDVQYIWMVLSKVDSVKFINADLYNYYLHGNSTMTSSNPSKIKTGFDGIDALYFAFIRDNPNVSNLVKAELIPTWKFSALHGAAKMLTYQAFKALVLDTISTDTLHDIQKSNNKKIQIIGYVLGGSTFLTYVLMKRF